MPIRVSPSFSFGFSAGDLVPMLQMQRVIQQDSALSTYLSQSVLTENIMRRQRELDEASVMARAVSEAETKTKESKEGKEDRASTTTYAITYFNPVLQSTEVLEAKSEINIKDYTTKVIEESVAAQSAFQIYKYIGTPIMRTEVLPWKLEEILAEREYGTPPPPPSGAAVTPVKIVARKESEIVAERRIAEELREALTAAIVRKEKSELKVGEELLLLEEAVEALRSGEDIDRVLARLPPLSRARYIIALRKKLLGRKALIQLLLHDISFLRVIKKKLEMFTLDDLVNMYKILRRLRKK